MDIHSTRFPAVASIDTIIRERSAGLEVIALARFTTGVELHYRRDHQGRVYEELFVPPDLHTPWRQTTVRGPSTAPEQGLINPTELLHATLNEYNYHLENHALAEFTSPCSPLTTALSISQPVLLTSNL